MKSSAEILAKPKDLWSDSSKPCENATNARPLADWTWRKMIEIYGAKWTREAGEIPSSTWTQAIGRQSHDAIKRALARIVAKHPDWPPTLPQFLAACTYQPEDFGAPSAESAWHEARNHAMQASSHQWSHDAVVFVGRKIGWGDIHRATGGYAVELQRRFKAEYTKAVDVLAQGVPLLQADSDKPASLHAELASVARADEAASEYQGINPEQSLRLMRAMTGEKRDG